MTESISARQMVLLWVAVLLGPIAWALSLALLFWFTHPVCQDMAGRAALWITGAACAAASVAAGTGAAWALARAGFPPESSGIAPFMMRLAVGMSAIFALVILLSMVPISMLTPCPL
jgi:hypothetical protein